MRLLSYSVHGTAGFGLLSADGAGVVDLRRRLGVADLSGLLAEGRLVEAASFAAEPSDHLLADVAFERLLPHPEKIFCIGVNYGGREAEYRQGAEASYPSVFVRFADSFTGHDRPLLRPPESEQLDYEGEIVVVIGTGGRRIPVEQARRHIAGVSLANEGTIRDWVRHGRFNVTQGKNWEGTGAIGPWLVTLDEIDDLETLRLTTRVNGELRQDDTPATMRYSIEYQIHYLSTFTTLRPGDVILTGTPTGAGARLDPPVWLQPGDVVEVSVPEIGTLRNTVADEALPLPERLEVLAGGAIGMRPFSQSLPMALLRAREAAMQRFRPLLAAHDVTEQQWRVLRALTAADGRLELTELAERTALQPPSASRIVANLTRRGLVERHGVDHDQRRTSLGLSPAGRVLVQRMAPMSEKAYNRIEAQFGAERLARLLEELAALAALPPADAEAGSGIRA